LLLGCGGVSSTTRPEAGVKNRVDEPFELARESFRRASNAASFHEALQQVNAHFDRDPEAAARLQKIKDQRDRALPPERLRELFGLEPDELAYLEATSFQPLDDHYLVEAFGLRDVARSLQLQALPKLQQAERALGWVTRQVRLREGNDETTPPWYVLRNGEGSARERALVFLGLLQQLNLDGCFIAVPGPSDPRFWAAGVLIEDNGKAGLYLFDTRLGLPLPGPGGIGIASFSQIKQNPDLLKQIKNYDITPDEVGKAEIYLASPLTALAPRMKALTDLLTTFDRVQLAVDPGSLAGRLEKSAGSKVGAWKPAASPARALRRFVSVEEGGVNKTGKAARQEQQLQPWPAITRALNDMQLDDLPPPAKRQLLQFSLLLYDKYALHAHDNLVRGRLDEATRRLIQAMSVLQYFDAARLPEGQFTSEVGQWRERVKQVSLALIRQAPDAPKLWNNLWAEDQFLAMLLMPREELDAGPGAAPAGAAAGGIAPKILSFIVIRSLAGSLRNETSYLQALCWQEKVERMETERARDPRRVSPKERQDKWGNVQDWWRKYAVQNPFAKPALHAHVKNLSGRVAPAEFGLLVGSWEWLFRDLRAGFHGRLLQAEGLEKTGKTIDARALLQNMANDLAGLRGDADLEKGLRSVRTQLGLLRSAAAQQRAPLEPLDELIARLDGLERDLGAGGSFAGLRTTAVYRLGQLR
jgi:hypothetical protein